MKSTQIQKKVSHALNTSDVDAILIAGSEMVQYLSGSYHPYILSHPKTPFWVYWEKNAQPVAIVPALWKNDIKRDGWLKEVYSYQGNIDSGADWLKTLQQVLGKKVKTLGVDLEGWKQGAFDQFSKAQTNIVFEPMDGWLDNLRMHKTADEIALLKDVAYRTDHGINGAIHHITVDRRMTALTLAEELRVHTQERGIALYGYHACARVASGKFVNQLWPLPPVFGYSHIVDFAEGDLIRMNVRTFMDGYWSDATRMMTMGEPSAEQSQGYCELVSLRDFVLTMMRPGMVCADIFNQVETYAVKENIQWQSQYGLGHGIGVAPAEKPYLSAGDKQVLDEDMVLVLTPIVKSKSGMLFQSNDTILIKKDGCEVMGWYKDWREPYIPIFSI
jgi:Xaa-Pro aminopeptidase